MKDSFAVRAIFFFNNTTKFYNKKQNITRRKKPLFLKYKSRKLFLKKEGVVRMRKKKELGLDNMGIQKQMHTSDYILDASGQVGMGIFTFLAGQLTYFYTDKVGITAGTVASILLIVKILDAFSDIIMGKIFDNTKSANGKCAPWFLRMAIPAFVVLISLFTVPKGLSGAGQFVYLLITNVIHTSIVATAVLIPYNSLLALRTNSVEERSKMSVIRCLVGMIIAMVLSIGLIPVTNALGGDQMAWIKLSVGAAIIVCISFLLTYKTSKNALDISAEEEKEKNNLSFINAIKMLVKNKYWILMMVLKVVSAVTYALSQASGVYYCKWILGNDNLVAILGAIGMLPTLVGYLIVVPISKKIGMINTIMGGYALSIVGSIVRCFMPRSFMVTLIAGSVITLGTIPMMCFSGVLTNNITTYNEWKYGDKMVGMTNSVLSFGDKVANGLGSAMLGWILALGAYNGALETQPDSAITAILAICIYIPLVIYVILFILVKQFDLEKIYPKLVKEIEERKNSEV